MHPTFYFDFRSPECYLAAERVNSTLTEVPVWEPVGSPALGTASGQRPPPTTGSPDPGDLADLKRRAAVQGLPPLRFPDPWPADVEIALRAATFAQSLGRVVAFSLAALRQAFAAGRDLSEVDNVLIAAAACELHPRAVLKAIESRSVAERLRTATAEAVARGVRGLPAVATAEGVFHGRAAVEAAAGVLGPSRLGR